MSGVDEFNKESEHLRDKIKAMANETVKPVDDLELQDAILSATRVMFEKARLLEALRLTFKAIGLDKVADELQDTAIYLDDAQTNLRTTYMGWLKK